MISTLGFKFGAWQLRSHGAAICTRRLISKTVPSAGTSTITYDRLDRPVLTHDAMGFKLFTRYDVLSRPVISGRYKGAASPTASDPLSEFPNTVAPFYYTSTAFPTDNNIDVYKAIYYDDYDLDNNGSLGTGETYTDPAESGYDAAAFLRTRGKPTASKTAILKNDNTTPLTYLTTRTYYDKEYSVIQINKQNHLSGADISSNCYDFANRLTKTRRDHTATPPGGTAQSQVVREEYVYDHASRLKFVRHKIGSLSNNWVVTSSPVYDELGRVYDKRLHASNYDGSSTVSSSSSFNFLQSIDYTYNIRGWLTGINDPSSCTTQAGDQLPDLFSMKLFYDAPTSGTGSATPQYNGNISEIQWRTNTEACWTLNAYRFSYDKGNRLTAASHWENTGTWTNADKYSESGISYDLNGNITKYKRRGMTAPNTFGVIDDLVYSYPTAKPDQLALVKDDLGSITKGFKRNSTSLTPFSYDFNGNLTTDLNKNMTVTYNHLNLPTSFTLGANLITMTYTADGEKLTKVAGSTTRNYVSGIEYLGANLEAIYTSEGRCKWTGTAFDYEYTIRDHLRNARVNFKASGAAVAFIEEMHYYPFGMLMEGTAGTASPSNDYSYNGKEFNEDFGLNLSDYGARWYDATIGRWWSVDPYASHIGDISGYNYVTNNPLVFIDPNGLWEQRADGQAYTTNNLNEIKDFLKAASNFSKNGFNVIEGSGQKGDAAFKLVGKADDGHYTSAQMFNEKGGKKSEKPFSVGNGDVKKTNSEVDKKAVDNWYSHEVSKFGPWCPQVMGVGVTISGNIGRASGSLSFGVAMDNSSIGAYGTAAAGGQVGWFSPLGIGVTIDVFGGDTFGNPSGSALSQLGGNDIVSSAIGGPISICSSSTANYQKRKDGTHAITPSISGLQTIGLSLGVGSNLVDVGIATSVSKSGIWSVKVR